MTYLIAYDIRDNKIRRRVAKFLEGIAYRRQYSVFWADLNDGEVAGVKKKLTEYTQKTEECTVLMVPLCKTCKEKLWMIGNSLEEYSDYIIV